MNEENEESGCGEPFMIGRPGTKSLPRDIALPNKMGAWLFDQAKVFAYECLEPAMREGESMEITLTVRITKSGIDPERLRKELAYWWRHVHRGEPVPDKFTVGGGYSFDFREVDGPCPK